jgi:hypothetical protein
MPEQPSNLDDWLFRLVGFDRVTITLLTGESLALGKIVGYDRRAVFFLPRGGTAESIIGILRDAILSIERPPSGTPGAPPDQDMQVHSWSMFLSGLRQCSVTWVTVDGEPHAGELVGFGEDYVAVHRDDSATKKDLTIVPIQALARLSRMP